MSQGDSCVEGRCARRVAVLQPHSERMRSRKKTASRPKEGYNLVMLLAVLAMRLLEIMFFVGLAGSAVVVLISFFEDGKELIGKDEPPERRA